MSDRFDIAASLAQFDNLPEARKPAVEAPTFPCQSCAGTGLYRGFRSRQTQSKCFACNGVGSFKTSHGDRMKARGASKARKDAKAEADRAAFHAEYPGLIDNAKAIASWHTFVQSMVTAFEQWNALTANQASALIRALEKVNAAREAKEAGRNKVSAVVDMTAIDAMFAAAKSNGLKRPIFRAANFALSLAPATGRNPGAVYVKSKPDDVYLGMIVGGAFKASRDATPETAATLNDIAADPKGFAKKYGIETGVCCCCGRQLTDPVSVAAGIGPDCADNWGY